MLMLMFSLKYSKYIWPKNFYICEIKSTYYKAIGHKIIKTAIDGIIYISYEHTLGKDNCAYSLIDGLKIIPVTKTPLIFHEYAGDKKPCN